MTTSIVYLLADNDYFQVLTRLPKKMTLVKAPIAQDFLAIPWTLKGENSTFWRCRLQYVET